MKQQICLQFFFFLTTSGEATVSRAMYDSMAQLVGEQAYPDLWWDQRQTCFEKISPGLSDTLELAWQGMVKYWDIGGVKEDYWIQCEDTEREWFEFNCTYLPNIGQRSRQVCYLKFTIIVCMQEWLFGSLAILCPILPTTDWWWNFAISQTGLSPTRQ